MATLTITLKPCFNSSKFFQILELSLYIGRVNTKSQKHQQPGVVLSHNSIARHGKHKTHKKYEKL